MPRWQLTRAHEFAMSDGGRVGAPGEEQVVLACLKSNKYGKTVVEDKGRAKDLFFGAYGGKWDVRNATGGVSTRNEPENASSL